MFFHALIVAFILDLFSTDGFGQPGLYTSLCTCHNSCGWRRSDCVTSGITPNLNPSGQVSESETKLWGSGEEQLGLTASQPSKQSAYSKEHLDMAIPVIGLYWIASLHQVCIV